MNLRDFLRLLPLAAGWAAAIGTRAALRAEPAVQLPTFTVTEPRLLPPPEEWRHGQVPGFEILSGDSDRRTERQVADFLAFQRAAGIVWPELRRNFDLAVYVVLCPRPRQFAEFAPAGSAGDAAATESVTLRDREQAAIAVNLEAAGGEGAGADLGDFSRQVLRGEYARFLVDRMEPRPPDWLRAGLTPILAGMSCAADGFTVPAAAGTGDLAARRAFRDRFKLDGEAGAAAAAADPELDAVLGRGGLVPLDRLFAARDPGGEGVWRRECLELAHLCLFGHGGRLADPFREFALRASLRAPDEAVFRECFGFGYREMLALLWGYAGFAEARGYAIADPDGKKNPPLPSPGLRTATDAEVGRIRGDIQRMGRRDEDSHLSLIAPYVRGSRDPELLAALGLEEYAAGRRERARRFLEAASSAGTVRARAYLELAQLRLDDCGPGGLGVEQLLAVFTPLARARALPPPLPEVYRLFARAWERSTVAPQRGHLMMIDDGVAYFPYDTELVREDAELRARYGFARDAAALARLGLRFAADGPERDRLARLAAPADGPEKK